MKKESSRQSPGTFFEGMTSVRAVLRAMEEGISDRRILRLLVAEERKSARAKELPWLCRMADKHGFTVEFVPESLLDELAVGTTHGGVAAECSERSVPELGSLTVNGGFWVMLEGIEDPYNFGYAIRSLYACGADGIVLSPRNWMSAAGVVCRSSAGASELLPVAVSDPVEAARTFRNNGFRVLAAGIRDSVSSFDCDMRKPLFLIVGGEKRGISASLLAEADQIVRIDYGRAFPGSLSAASAASMLAYEVMRQNKTTE
ncbi:MAG: RNA methyltransferase [Ruminococcaceae bacterium]|nr:RNA methyltransferase [Oscillospiraceae bacterium]